MRVTFAAWGIAQPKGSTRAFLPKGWTRPVVTSDNPKTKGWQQTVAEAALAAMPSPVLMDGPVSLDVTFYLKRPKSLGKKSRAHTTKPDLDKLVRSVKDALTHIVWHDDSQVIAVQAWKFYAAPDELPHAFVDVRSVDDEIPLGVQRH